jgi:hypothetical protein
MIFRLAKSSLTSFLCKGIQNFLNKFILQNELLLTLFQRFRKLGQISISEDKSREAGHGIERFFADIPLII